MADEVDSFACCSGLGRCTCSSIPSEIIGDFTSATLDSVRYLALNLGSSSDDTSSN